MKVGFVCDSPLLPTGYAKAAHNLAIQLQKLGNDVSFCPMQYMGQPLDLGYGTIYEGDEAQSVQRYLDSVHPDVVINLRDSFVLSPRYGANAGGASYLVPKWCQERNIRFISYSPVHASPLSMEEIKIAHSVDFNLTMSRWGRDLMALQGVPRGMVDYLYHGVDTSIYKPLNKQKCREELGFPLDKKIMGSVAVNYDYRKMLPLTMKAFQLLLKTIPDTHLVLWTEPVAFWDLEQWAVNLNIRDKVSFANTSKSWGMSEDFMAKLYNCFDVYVNTATSEGFGLPILEALACDVPVVCTDTPVLREIFQNQAIDFIPSEKLFPIMMGSFEWMIRPDDAAFLVERVLNRDTKTKGDISLYSWERAAVKLDSILDDIINKKWVSGEISDDQLASSMEHESFLRDDILTNPATIELGNQRLVDGTFYDIGAHAGRWSVRASRYYARVIAVEPMPETMSALLGNIELNVCKNIDVRAVAISNKEGFVRINQYENDGWNSVHIRPDPIKTALTVPCTTLDNLVAAMKEKPTTVKIDVEAHEREVLEGGEQTLKTYHPKLVIEVHNDSFLTEIEDRLIKWGYTRFRYQKDSWHAPTCTYMVVEK